MQNISTKPSSAKGFTIVELLIVIVVIAILSTIVLVTFQGVRERAYNTRIIAGVRSYYNAIELYRTTQGKYPATSDEITDQYLAMTCLGRGYPGGTCGTVTGKVIYEDATFYTQLDSVVNGTTSQLAENNLNVGSEYFTGAVYGIDTVTGGGRARTIQYALIGENTSCTLPGAVGYNRSTNPATTACEIQIEPYP